MESSWRITSWKLESVSKRRNSSSTIGCGERMQTFSNLEFAVALTIVTKASGIGAQGQERWRSGFHTRHGYARREFQRLPSQGLMTSRPPSGEHTRASPLKAMDLAGQTAGWGSKTIRRVRRQMDRSCAPAALPGGRPGAP